MTARVLWDRTRREVQPYYLGRPVSGDAFTLDPTRKPHVAGQLWERVEAGSVEHPDPIELRGGSLVKRPSIYVPEPNWITGDSGYLDPLPIGALADIFGRIYEKTGYRQWRPVKGLPREL